MKISVTETHLKLINNCLRKQTRLVFVIFKYKWRINIGHVLLTIIWVLVDVFQKLRHRHSFYVDIPHFPVKVVDNLESN